MNRRTFLTQSSLATLGSVLRETPASNPDDVALRGAWVGYQGWFRTPDDGSNLGWVHWGHKGKFDPDHCTVDLWPDVSGLPAEDRVSTVFRHPDQRVACVFSSHRATTVRTHFEWVQRYGITGVWVQRFVTQLASPVHAAATHRVLRFARDAAHATKRYWGIMYDLSGLRAGGPLRAMEDWAALRRELALDDDPWYVRHRGRILVAVWGVGFSDGRAYSLDECRELIEALRGERGGRCSVLVGVPFYWRSLRRDALPQPALHEILRAADIVLPWSVGRYRTSEEVSTRILAHWQEDVAWCRSAGVDFLPVVFPGFSWHNLERMRGRTAPLNQIPRGKGQFLWSQFHVAQRTGLRGAYVAMFDEVDEGTAIFPCVNDPPSTERCPFGDYEGLPSDHYLWLTGRAGAALASNLEIPPAMPTRTQPSG